MTKQTNKAPQRATPKTPKTPTTTDAVRRVQRTTAEKNGGRQADWVRRLQSTADKRAGNSLPSPTPKRTMQAVLAGNGQGGKSPPAAKGR